MKNLIKDMLNGEYFKNQNCKKQSVFIPCIMKL